MDGNDLTITNANKNSAAVVILNSSIAAGKAVQFKVVGQKRGKEYLVKIKFVTDSTPARTKNYGVKFQVAP